MSVLATASRFGDDASDAGRLGVMKRTADFMDTLIWLAPLLGVAWYFLY